MWKMTSCLLEKKNVNDTTSMLMWKMTSWLSKKMLMTQHQWWCEKWQSVKIFYKKWTLWMIYIKGYIYMCYTKVKGCYNMKDHTVKKQGPMGHIAHLRKQFKSINTDYIITLIKTRKKPLLLSLWELNCSSLNKIESHSPKEVLCQVWLKLAQWFWRRRFFNFVNEFFAFSLLSPFGKGQGPSFEQTWIPFTQGCFVPSLVEIGSVVLEKKIF